jgi:hypothetical protein
MRRRILAVAAAVALTGAVAACGSVAASPAAHTTSPAAHTTMPAATMPATTTTTPVAAPSVPAGYTSCGSGVYAGPDTSCPFALNVWRAATADGDTPVVTAYSPVTGKYYSLALTSTDPYIYNGASNGNTAIVEWWPSTPTATAAPVTAPPATVTPGAPVAGTTTPAKSAGSVLWCGQVAYGGYPETITPLAAWLAYQKEQGNLGINGKRTEFTTTTDDIEAAGTTSADEYQLGTALCEEVRDADAFPPPAQLVYFDEAMGDFYDASIQLHDTRNTASALPYLTNGTAAMNAFLTAVES